MPTRRLSYKYGIHAVAVSLVATLIVLAFTMRENTLEALRSFPLRYAGLCLLSVGVAWGAACARLTLWVRSLGYRLSFWQVARVALSAEFAIGATPAGVGGPIARVGLLNWQGVPISHGMAMQAADIVMDVLFFVILAPFALHSVARYSRQLAASGDEPATLLHVFLVFVCAAGVVVWLARLDAVGGRAWRWLLRRRLAIRVGLHEKLLALRRRLHRGWHEFREGLHVLTRMPWYTVLGAFVCTVFMWSGRYLVLPIVLLAIGSTNFDPVLLFLVQGILFAGGMSVLLPGGGGSVEVAFSVLIKPLAPPGTIGIVLLLWRFFTYQLYLLVGACVFSLTVSDARFLAGGVPLGEDDPAPSGADETRETG